MKSGYGKQPETGAGRGFAKIGTVNASDAACETRRETVSNRKGTSSTRADQRQLIRSGFSR
jgi:hypothetical protein